MQLQDDYSEIALLRTQLKSATEKFDQAVKKDVQLGDLKVLYHEMKELTMKLEALMRQKSNTSKT